MSGRGVVDCGLWTVADFPIPPSHLRNSNCNHRLHLCPLLQCSRTFAHSLSGFHDYRRRVPLYVICVHSDICTNRCPWFSEKGCMSCGGCNPDTSCVNICRPHLANMLDPVAMRRKLGLTQLSMKSNPEEFIIWSEYEEHTNKHHTHFLNLLPSPHTVYLYTSFRSTQSFSTVQRSFMSLSIVTDTDMTSARL